MPTGTELGNSENSSQKQENCQDNYQENGVIENESKKFKDQYDDQTNVTLDGVNDFFDAEKNKNDGSIQLHSNDELDVHIKDMIEKNGVTYLGQVRIGMSSLLVYTNCSLDKIFCRHLSLGWTMISLETNVPWTNVATLTALDCSMLNAKLFLQNQASKNPSI